MATRNDTPLSELEIDEVREATRAALGLLGAKQLKALCEAHTGETVKTDDSQLGKFGRGEVKIRASDLETLRQLLFMTSTGDLLRRDGQSFYAPITALFEASMAGNLAREEAEQFNGAFLGYHGSYMYPERFVVRAFNFKRVPNGLVTVTDHLRDEYSPAPADIKASGVLATLRKPQIFMTRHDNAIGFNLIVGDYMAVTAKSTVLIGQMTGINGRDEHFARPILLRKDSRSIDELHPITGIYAADELPESARSEFLLLQRSLPRSACPDPIAMLNRP